MLLNPQIASCPDCSNMLEIMDATDQVLDCTCTGCFHDFTLDATIPEVAAVASEFILNNVLAEC